MIIPDVFKWEITSWELRSAHLHSFSHLLCIQIRTRTRMSPQYLYKLHSRDTYENHLRTRHDLRG